MFEDWLEQEQGSLASLSHPDGNVDTLEKTLAQLQVLILMGVVHNAAWTVTVVVLVLVPG